MKVTVEMIANIPAGRELDALIAEHVFGYQRRRYHKGNSRVEGRHAVMLLSPDELADYEDVGMALPLRGDEFWDVRVALFHTPLFSANMADCWQVVEAMQKHEQAGTCGPLWWNFWQSGYVHIWELPAAEAAVSICRAALAAVVIEVPGYEELFQRLSNIYKQASD
jgi:hypothetical protein